MTDQCDPDTESKMASKLYFVFGAGAADAIDNRNESRECHVALHSFVVNCLNRRAASYGLSTESLNRTY